MKSRSLRKFKAKEFLSLPKSMEDARSICITLCINEWYGITFDDHNGNFGGAVNICSCCKDQIECSVFDRWNYDLLVFAVMHEIGHLNYEKHDTNVGEGEPKDYHNKHSFAREFACWEYAVDLYMEMFGQNISIKQARYMMDSLMSYVPDYNSSRENGYIGMDKDYLTQMEKYFWCPIRGRTIR